MSSANDSGLSNDRPELVQGSPEWFAERCGRITASCFGKLAGSGKSGGWSQTALTYMTQVLAERLTGRPQDEISSKYLDHGNKYEPTARQFYQWNMPYSLKLQQVGFIRHPDIPNCGGSPDCLVGDDGILEIKCPYTIHTHIAHIENDATSNRDYVWQMQGNLWVTNRKWCDFVSFHPFVPKDCMFHVVRYERDNDVIDEIAERVIRAEEQIVIRMKRINEKVRTAITKGGE